MRFFFAGGVLDRLCTLWLRSERVSGAERLCLSFRLNSEKTGRLPEFGGGDFSSAGEDGGDDRVGASEEVGSDGCGLELSGAELMRVGEEASTGDSGACVVDIVGSAVSETRLRLVGGSSS